MDTKSAFASKINWTQIVAMLAMLLTIFGIDVPEDVKLALVGAIQGVASVITWILRTWFTTTLTHSSSP